ncbi:hypothetical protein KSS87_002051 [Heliosperma pusillum]|nr:hypothetical protein KSS87_002051 [Heliosperma pusillum]
MAGSDENNPTIITHSNIQQGAMQNRKMMAPIGHNRRALRDINRNFIGAPPYPCATNKRTNFGKDALSENNLVVSGHRPVASNDAFSENNLAIPSHRPVTRKFAAQMGNVHHYMTEEIKKPSNLNASVGLDDDCTIIDADDNKATNENEVPMFVQHTEAMLEEIDCMAEEVEMEDIDELVLDIDSCDKENPLAVTEYIDDIYAYYKKVENCSCVPSSYMEVQPDINERMRAILIDWLIEVHYKFELMEETLYLTVNLIDRFLALKPVVRKKLQLVGVTAMLLASKYEEVSVPVVEDLVLISDKAYSRQEVLEMERSMVNSLQFNMSIPTPYVFMKRFLKAAEADKKTNAGGFVTTAGARVVLSNRAMLGRIRDVAIPAITVSSSSSVYGTVHSNRVQPLEQDLNCSRQMVSFHQKAATGKLTGVHRKYSTSKYGYTAKREPALFLLDSPSGFGQCTFENRPCLNAESLRVQCRSGGVFTSPKSSIAEVGKIGRGDDSTDEAGVTKKFISSMDVCSSEAEVEMTQTRRAL